MDDKKAIYWHQGMFMQPQHFQMADLHGQFRNKPLMDAGLPHFWGLGGLTLSTLAVANRTIEVEQVQLLFGERSYIEYPGNAVIAPRSFDSAWVEGPKPFIVYLGLKKLNAQEQNATPAASLSEAAGVATRYASLDNPPDVRDLYSDGPVAQVRTLLHVIKVFFSSEVAQLSDYDLIPIARLVREGDSIKLSDQFIPPCYTLGGSSVLLRVVKDVRDELAGRAHQLQEYKHPNTSQKAEFDASYMLFLMALSVLNRASPYLHHLTETPQVHPWLVYGALRQLIGDLSTFSERVNMHGEAADGAPGLPPYDHSDLHSCFARAHTLISSLLNDITVGPEFLATLIYNDGCYGCDLPHKFFDRLNRFYLVVRCEQNPVNAILHDARLAAGDEIPGLIAHALPGLELIHMAAPPQGLPRRTHSYYFRIEQVSQLWDVVESRGSIALQWPDAPADMKADIVALRK